jgi:hypothetical protein
MTIKDTKLNLEVLKNIQVTSQENMIIKSLEKFYEDPINVNIFISIVTSKSETSIRLIDHFSTKYSKNNKTSYKLIENDIENQFNVFSSYKQQLKAFQKKHFDPFSRGDRLPYFMGNTCIITTIGQLNFFKWFISKKIYEYIMANDTLIEIDMNKRGKYDKKKIKKKTQKYKIKNINKSPSTIINYDYTNKASNLSNTLSFGTVKQDKIIVTFN